MFDGDIAITPFNLKEEQQEGSFTKDGNNKVIIDCYHDDAMQWL